MNCLLPLFHFLLTSRQTALFRSTLCWMDNWIWGNFRALAFSPSAMPIRWAFLGRAGNERSCKKRRPLTGSKSIRLTSSTSHTSAVNCNISPTAHILIFLLHLTYFIHQRLCRAAFSSSIFGFFSYGGNSLSLSPPPLSSIVCRLGRAFHPPPFMPAPVLFPHSAIAREGNSPNTTATKIFIRYLLSCAW